MRVWFRRSALPILRVRRRLERESLGATQQREVGAVFYVSHMRLKASTPFLWTWEVKDEG
jgi:hypothetical protein